MKKSIFAIVLVLALCAVLLCACKDEKSEPNLNKLNDMAAASYSQIKLSVNTVFPDAILKNTFEVTNNGADFSVKYHLEKFAELSIDKPVDSSKEVVEGTAVVKEGSVSVVSGVELNKLTKLSMRFNKDYFANLELTDSRFTAEVTNPTAFFGVATFSGTDVKVDVSFGEVLQTLQVTYLSANGANVTIAYEFTK